MKSLKESCKFAYNNLNKLEDSIRAYAESILKKNREGNVEFEIACEAIESVSFARGQILLFKGVLDGRAWLEDDE